MNAASSGDALARAALAVRAAQALRHAGGDAPDWDLLTAWPAWALPPQGPDPQLLRLGAFWHADVLAHCIDGARLQAARVLLGDTLLQALLDAEPPGAGAAGLPPPQALEPVFMACGRALARTALADARLRRALAAAEPLPAPAAIEALAPAAAAAWAEAAQRLPLPEQPR